MSLVNFTEITVKSTARLHMGFFDLHGGLGRKFGSIGLSLAAPSIELSAMRSEKLCVSGFASHRAEEIARLLIAKLNITGAVNLAIKQTMPEHAGMGSGTQFALTIGTAISQLYSLNLNTAQIAELTGRGGRSGIGIAAFDQGGLLIDGGRVSHVASSHASKAPPLIARYDFPEDWRILLILDNNQPGIHGEEELAAFKTLPIFPENLAAHLCRSVLMQAMPAMVEKDLTAFGYSIRELQMHVGDYFAPAQGGRYASKYVGAVLQHLETLGVACYGQSSWGPTGFAVFENEELAQKTMLELKMKFTEPNLTWQICSANNNGSEILTA
ncbi:beta-ribofuranosylaminobenzene 5'-phosphate synthase family protein [Methylotenera versatilis]|uniref:Beta-ribofuranosylaminobenzene 5'-phosphate synthase family n=1 Tax=Methylotenera versatilis (strain 301) TaxID=666681 RepID=D7DIQ2_METV0|nr:beta-ribofuranosylaminobenzene 5'-phosphate synthase family protein [Methylotenera versatilis]ADI29937.1 beta-ribofuranosylaminobenzene 5'-phosphate synthase family [Methylotenera versatilis 301]